MGTVRKTITLTDQQNAWVAEQVDAGLYTTDSEAIRDLIRREQERIQAANMGRPHQVGGDQTMSADDDHDDDDSDDWADDDEHDPEEDSLDEDERECGVCNGTGNGTYRDPDTDERYKCGNCDGTGLV